MAHDTTTGDHEPVWVVTTGVYRYAHKSSAARRARVLARRHGRRVYVCADHGRPGADTYDGRRGPSWVVTMGAPYYAGSRWYTYYPPTSTSPGGPTTTTTTTTMGG